MTNIDLKINNHRIVVIVARKERGIALKNLLARFRCEAIIAMGLYEGLQVIIQEMPHLILTESSLPDGDAGLLYDRLTQNSKFKNTPILVNVLKRTRKELEAVAKRKFAGFFLGVSDPKLIISKLQEVLATHCIKSPYHQDTRHLAFNESLSVAIDAKILGRTKNFLVTSSSCDLDFAGKWKCSPTSKALEPIMLSLGSNLNFENQRYNLFPIAAIIDKGRTWVDELPVLGKESKLVNSSLVIYYHPDSQQGKRLANCLAGYGLNALPVSRFEEIKPLIESSKGKIASVVLDQLPENYPLKNLERECGVSSGVRKPIFIVASEKANMQSRGALWFIQKPCGLMELLCRIFASLLDPKELASAAKNTSQKDSEVRFTTSAQVIGLDEMGGFLNTYFPIYQGAQLSLEHTFFKNLFGTQGRIHITGIVNGAGDLWCLRFTSVAKGLSKGKYLDQVQRELENILQETDQAETFLTQKNAD